MSMSENKQQAHKQHLMVVEHVANIITVLLVEEHLTLDL